MNNTRTVQTLTAETVIRNCALIPLEGRKLRINERCQVILPDDTRREGIVCAIQADVAKVYVC